MKNADLINLSTLALTLVTSSLAGGGMPGGAATAQQAHEAYIRAINGDNIDALMGMLADDIVYQNPNEPEIMGRTAVRA